jgi:hypothetical protein
MMQALNQRLQGWTWDLAVFLTDLPYRDQARPVVAMLSPSDHIALLSLPSLGLFRVPRRVRDATLGVITELLPEAPGRTPVPGRIQYAGQQRNYVLPGARGRLRLLSGMVRANRPWVLFPGLSHALVGVFATAAFGLISSDVRSVSLHLERGSRRRVDVRVHHCPGRLAHRRPRTVGTAQQRDRPAARGTVQRSH